MGSARVSTELHHFGNGSDSEFQLLKGWLSLHRDLYGAVGFPLRLSRTVVIGKKADLVCKLLYVLSYFMRCSEVLETEEYPDSSCNDLILDNLVSIKSGMETIQESLMSRTNSSADFEGSQSVSQTRVPEGPPAPVIPHSSDSHVTENPVGEIKSETILETETAVDPSHDPSVIRSKVLKFFRVLDHLTASRIQEEALAMSNTLLPEQKLSVSEENSDAVFQTADSSEQEDSGLRLVVNRHLGRQSDSSAHEEAISPTPVLSRVSLKPNDLDSPSNLLREHRIKKPGEKGEGPKQDSGIFDLASVEISKENLDKVVTECENQIVNSAGNNLDPQMYRQAIGHMQVIAESISCSRTNSMFDEYFTDNSEEAVNTRSSLYKRFASIEGSSSIFDEYLSNPVVDFENCDIQGCEEEEEGEDAAKRESELSMKDEHFTVERGSSVDLPESTTKDLVKSTLTLMQDVMSSEHTEDATSLMSLETSTSTLEGRNSASIVGRHPSFSGQVSTFSRQTSSQSTGLPARCRYAPFAWFLYFNLHASLHYLRAFYMNIFLPSWLFRSITPTELGRRRHLSQTSLNQEVDSAEIFDHLSEIPLPR